MKYGERRRSENPQPATLFSKHHGDLWLDLHIYGGYIPQCSKVIIGHEFMGEIVEVGSGVNNEGGSRSRTFNNRLW